MPAVTGRTNEGRSVAGVVRTNAAATITAPANSFEEEDAGRTIAAAGIPAGATILSVQSPTAATMSAPASSTTTGAVTLGPSAPEQAGFIGWSPESDAESETYTVAAVNAGAVSPDRITSPSQGRDQRFARIDP